MSDRLDNAIRWANRREVERLLHALSTHHTIPHQAGAPYVVKTVDTHRKKAKNASRGQRFIPPGHTS